MFQARVNVIVVSLLLAAAAFGQDAKLRVKWEELTAP